MERIISAEIISTGSELMLGRTVDTNSAWLSDFLGRRGMPTVRHTAVGDDLERLTESFRRSWSSSPLTVVTGGLGPTEDDLTRPAAARAFGLELEFREELAEELRALFKSRGFTMTDNNLRQAWLPRIPGVDSSRGGGPEVQTTRPAADSFAPSPAAPPEAVLVVPNPVGTAPGFALAGGGRLMVFLPGVPREMKIMAETWLSPQLKEQFPELSVRRHTVILNTAGLGESRVDDLVGDLMSPGRNPAVGLLAGPEMVRVLITAVGRDQAEAEALAAAEAGEIEKRLSGHVFGRGEAGLPEVLAGLLKERDLSLTILDAVTQGRLNGRLSPSLALENWSGGQDLPRQPALSGVTEILRLYSSPDSAAARLDDGDPDPGRRRHGREILLIVAARPDPEASPGQLALAVECAVRSEALGDGRAQVSKFRLGGGAPEVLARAAALSMFHLWRVLKGWEE